MRICSPQLGISPYSILGGEIYDRQILKYLAEQGNEIDILLPLLKPIKMITGWHVYRVPVPFVVPPHLYSLLVLPQLLYLYRKYHFDILRIHSPSFLGFAAYVFKKIYSQVPIVASYHWLGEGGWLDKYINPLVINSFDAIVCDSIFTKKQIEQKYHQLKSKVFAVHNGVDEILKPTLKNQYLLKQLNINKSATVLLYMGLFISRKNPLFLLPIIKKLIINKHKVIMIYCGQGPLEYQLKNEITRQGLEPYCRVVQPVFGGQKNNLLNLADIFVHPAIQEGFSLSVIEAMAVGLPIIITDGFSASEAILNHVNGFLCTTPKDWVRQICTLIINKNLRNKMSQENIQIVKKKFNWKISAEKHQLIFNRLIHK